MLASQAFDEQDWALNPAMWLSTGALTLASDGDTRSVGNRVAHASTDAAAHRQTSVCRRAAPSGCEAPRPEGDDGSPGSRQSVEHTLGAAQRSVLAFTGSAAQSEPLSMHRRRCAHKPLQSLVEPHFQELVGTRGDERRNRPRPAEISGSSVVLVAPGWPNRPIPEALPRLTAWLNR